MMKHGSAMNQFAILFGDQFIVARNEGVSYKILKRNKSQFLHGFFHSCNSQQPFIRDFSWIFF